MSDQIKSHQERGMNMSRTEFKNLVVNALSGTSEVMGDPMLDPVTLEVSAYVATGPQLDTRYLISIRKI